MSSLLAKFGWYWEFFWDSLLPPRYYIKDIQDGRF